jgi:hypothetical protein
VNVNVNVNDSALILTRATAGPPVQTPTRAT